MKNWQKALIVIPVTLTVTVLASLLAGDPALSALFGVGIGFCGATAYLAWSDL